MRFISTEKSKAFSRFTGLIWLVAVAFVVMAILIIGELGFFAGGARGNNDRHARDFQDWIDDAATFLAPGPKDVERQKEIIETRPHNRRTAIPHVRVKIA